MPSGISIDRDFARFGQKSYAINKINSVEVRERRPNSASGAVIMGILCLIAAIGALNRTAADIGNVILLLIFAAFAGWCAYALWQRSRIIEYQLFLMTSSLETQAFVSRDEEEVANLRDTIERAMAGR